MDKGANAQVRVTVCSCMYKLLSASGSKDTAPAGMMAARLQVMQTGVAQADSLDVILFHRLPDTGEWLPCH